MILGARPPAGQRQAICTGAPLGEIWQPRGAYMTRPGWSSQLRGLAGGRPIRLGRDQDTLRVD
eukprot:1418846-Pyramimonas_sp.AAC.1